MTFSEWALSFEESYNGIFRSDEKDIVDGYYMKIISRLNILYGFGFDDRHKERLLKFGDIVKGKDEIEKAKKALQEAEKTLLAREAEIRVMTGKLEAARASGKLDRSLNEKIKKKQSKCDIEKREIERQKTILQKLENPGDFPEDDFVVRKVPIFGSLSKAEEALFDFIMRVIPVRGDGKDILRSIETIGRWEEIHFDDRLKLVDYAERVLEEGEWYSEYMTIPWGEQKKRILNPLEYRVVHNAELVFESLIDMEREEIDTAEIIPQLEKIDKQLIELRKKIEKMSLDKPSDRLTEQIESYLK